MQLIWNFESKLLNLLDISRCPHRCPHRHPHHPAQVGSADAQVREGHQGDAGRNGPAGEEGAIDEEAVEARVGGEEAGGQGHHDVVAHSGVVWVDAQPEDFEQHSRRNHFPKHDVPTIEPRRNRCRDEKLVARDPRSAGSYPWD